MKKEINLFFSIDNNYCPFLSTALVSIMQNANKNFTYNVYILHNGVSPENQAVIKTQPQNANAHFVDISDKLESLASKLVTRDYYTSSTYSRLFIPNMFPHLDKGLYLDSDIVVNGDISALYQVKLGSNLVGAIPDAAVQNTPEFKTYVEKALGINSEQYFNAGILLMNLKEMRKWNFEDKFIKLLGTYSFRVAQDQDYLNVITNGKVKYIDYDWNVMPIPNNVCHASTRNLVHYNMLWKPWMFEGTLYEEDFWSYAKSSPMYEAIQTLSHSYDDEKRMASMQGGKNLLNLALQEAHDQNNFRNKFLSEVI